jgi:hypothetical protein
MMTSMLPPYESSEKAGHRGKRPAQAFGCSLNLRRSLAAPVFALLMAATVTTVSAWSQGGPQFQNGFPRPGQPARRDPAENQAYSGAVAEPNLSARISAIQQFLVNYPTSTLRQPAIAQLLAAQKELRAAGGGNQPAPVNRLAPAVAASTPVVAESTAPQRDSLLQQPPKQAQITIEPHSLEIKADNSTLSEILQKIASSTGMKLEGFSKDERVFGSYGPGETHDVLLSLLEGSGYNVLMVGEVGDGRAPRELSLSPRTIGTTPAAPNAAASNAGQDDDDDQEVQQEGPPVLPGRPNLGNQPIQPGDTQAQPRSPQQVLQDLQRPRQQQDPNQTPQ